MKARCLITATAVGLSSVGAAQAEGYSVSDLGTMPSTEACVAKAKNVLQRYESNYGAAKLDTGTWVAYGWDLRPGDQDVVITCASASMTGPDTRRAILVVYGEASSNERKATRDILKLYWKE